MMTKTQKNKIIADFIGLELLKDLLATLHNGKISIDTDIYEQCLFHSDYNWLMSAINKIQSVVEDPEDIDFLKDSIWFKTIDGVYEDVIDCIKLINDGTIQKVKIKSLSHEKHNACLLNFSYNFSNYPIHFGF